MRRIGEYADLAAIQARIAASRAEARAQRETAERAFYAAGGSCYACRDTGWQVGALNAVCAECDRGQRVLAARVADAVERVTRQIGIPARRASESLDTFTIHPLDSGQQDALHRTMDYTERFERHYQQGGRFAGIKGAFWTGATYGVGKTGLMIGALKRLAEVYARLSDGAPPLPGAAGARATLRFVLAADMLDLLREGYDRGDYAEQKRTLQQTPVLALDDLGAERATEWTQEQLFTIINWRYEHMLPTLVTSNHSAAELRARIGERTADRLVEMCETIPVSGQNLRR